MSILSGWVFKIFIPVVVIISVCFFAYKTLIKMDQNRIDASIKITEQRIDDIKEYEGKVYRQALQVVRNEKTKMYIFMFGSLSIILVFGLQALMIILRLPKEFLVNPNLFEIVHKKEAEALKYIRDKLIERNIIKDDTPLLKEDIMRLLTYRNDES